MENHDSTKFLISLRLFGDFHLVDSVSDSLIEKDVDVSFVNNNGRSWILSIESIMNDKNVIDQSTQSYAYTAFIENSLSYSKTKKKETYFSNAYWVNDEEKFWKEKISIKDMLL